MQQKTKKLQKGFKGKMCVPSIKRQQSISTTKKVDKKQTTGKAANVPDVGGFAHLEM